jgi:hypothetical protein
MHCILKTIAYIQESESYLLYRNVQVRSIRYKRRASRTHSHVDSLIPLSLSLTKKKVVCRREVHKKEFADDKIKAALLRVRIQGKFQNYYSYDRIINYYVIVIRGFVVDC